MSHCPQKSIVISHLCWYPFVSFPFVTPSLPWNSSVYRLSHFLPTSTFAEQISEVFWKNIQIFTNMTNFTDCNMNQAGAFFPAVNMAFSCWCVFFLLLRFSCGQKNQPCLRVQLRSCQQDAVWLHSGNDLDGMGRQVQWKINFHRYKLVKRYTETQIQTHSIGLSNFF